MKYFKDEYAESLTAIEPFGGKLVEADNSPSLSKQPKESEKNQTTDKEKLQQVILSIGKKDITAIMLDNYLSKIILIITYSYNTDFHKWSLRQDKENSFSTLQSQFTNNELKKVETNKRVYYIENDPNIGKLREILASMGFSYNERPMTNNDWVYANGEVSKSWGKNWGSEVLGSVSSALGTQGNMSWVGTGK